MPKLADHIYICTCDVSIIVCIVFVQVGELPQVDTLALLPISIKPERSGLLGTGDIVGFKINEAKIVKPDISCSNGIIHGVDSLVSPFLLFRYLVGAFPTP